jgi:hypothetical protein
MRPGFSARSVTATAPALSLHQSGAQASGHRYEMRMPYNRSERCLVTSEQSRAPRNVTPCPPPPTALQACCQCAVAQQATVSCGAFRATHRLLPRPERQEKEREMGLATHQHRSRCDCRRHCHPLVILSPRSCPAAAHCCHHSAAILCRSVCTTGKPAPLSVHHRPQHDDSAQCRCQCCASEIVTSPQRAPTRQQYPNGGHAYQRPACQPHATQVPLRPAPPASHQPGAVLLAASSCAARGSPGCGAGCAV